MIAVDTNVWVRYVTNDDRKQAARAVELLKVADEVFLPKTVLLELEWVLRAVYELPKKAVLKSLFHILGLPNVYPEQPEQVAAALDYYERGLDLADALHLISSGEEVTFHTFDTKFAKRAKSLGAKVERV